MREMVVFPRSGVWHVEHVGDADVFDAFGTTVLPTPFTTVVAVEDVMAVIENRNPGASVDWFESEAQWRAEVQRGSARLAEMAGVPSTDDLANGVRS